MRISEIAQRTGTTARTIRYYEELGLLDPAADRAKGKHREYDEADVERLADLLRLRELLGVSLEELKQIAYAEDARAALRQEWQGDVGDARRLEILREALDHVTTQLDLVRSRRDALDRLERELVAKRRTIETRLRTRSLEP